MKVMDCAGYVHYLYHSMTLNYLLNAGEFINIKEKLLFEYDNYIFNRENVQKIYLYQ